MDRTGNTVYIKIDQNVLVHKSDVHFSDIGSVECTDMFFYNAQVSTAKVVCLVSGGCLLLTAIVMLLFYIKHYIDTHKKELGILKALGYSNIKIACR